jgi:hypothetical protein
MTPIDPERRKEPSWRWDYIEGLREQQQDGHRRLRQDLSNAIEAMHREYREWRAKVDQLKDDVLTIKVQRAEEEKQALRRTGSVSFLVTAGITVLIKLAEWLWKR